MNQFENGHNINNETFMYINDFILTKIWDCLLEDEHD